MMFFIGSSPHVEDTSTPPQTVSRVRIGLSSRVQQTQPATAATVIQSTLVGNAQQVVVSNSKLFADSIR